MNSTANRPPKPPVPKFNMIGAGTDTPDFSEPDTEATNSSTCVQAVKDCSNLIALSERDNKGSKKLTALIEIMEEQVQDLQSLMDIEPVKKQAIKLICSLSDEDLKGKKYSSVTAAAIVHASRLLNLPITMKQILSKIECCDKQMKKVLAILQAQYAPPQENTVEAFLKVDCQCLGVNDQFYSLCESVLDFFRRNTLIGGEHDHVIAATIIKVTNDLIFGMHGFSIATIANKAKCSEYAMKTMLKKAYPYGQDIYQQMTVKYEKAI